MKDLIDLIDDYLYKNTDFILNTEFYMEQYSYSKIKEENEYSITTYADGKEEVYIIHSKNNKRIKEADIRSIEELEEFIKEIY